MNPISIITAPIEEEMKEFKTLFDDSFVNSTPMLGQVLDYVKGRGGKMMRPMLLLLVAKAYSGRVTTNSLHSAVTVEMLHTASLIHDDVVDESDERRGQASVNALFNNKVSVLVGDYMLSTSLRHAALTGRPEMVSLVADLGRQLATGEILQLSAVDDQTISESVYFEIIRKKTAVLFATCAQLGAMSVDAPVDVVENARLFGEYLGICFQIKDDLFDYSAGAKIGKPTGNDMREGKLTLPAIYVLTHCSNDEILQLAYKVKRLEASIEEIQILVDFVKINGGLDYAEQLMKSYYKKAMDLIPSTADDAVKTALRSYLDYVVDRTK